MRTRTTASTRPLAPPSTALILSLLLLGPLGCGGGGGTGNTPVVASISVSLSAATVEVGQTVQATANPRDQDGNPLSRSVVWSSSNSNVATVSSSGLVTGVTAGPANIIATIGSVQGQASLTVTSAAPTISGVTLRAANGQALNLSNVAGTIGIDLNLNVPAGTTGGTLIATIGGVEFVRQTVNAGPPQLRFGLEPAMITVGAHLDVNTASVGYTVANEQLQALPLASNGNRILELAYLAPGATQPSATSQSSVNLANPDALTGRYRQNGSLVLIDGKSWSANDLDLEVVPIRFGADAIQEVQVNLANNQAEFGSGALSGVINVVTKTGDQVPTRTTLTRSGFQYESSRTTGTNFYFSSYRFGSTNSTPQTAEPSRNGNCLYTRGTGVVQPFSVANPVALAAGCQTWVRPTPIPSNLLGGWNDLSALFYHDTKAPFATAGAFTLATRPQVADASAFGAFGGFGVLDNHVGDNYDFGWGVDASKFFDLGSGFDPNQNYELHGSFTPGFTPGPSTLITSYGSLPETGAARNYFFTGGWRDKVGNIGYVPLTTRTGNAWTVGNQLSLNLGVDLAAVSVNDNGGTATYAGPWDGYVFRSANTAGLNFGFNYSGSPVGYAANASMWGRVYRDLDPTKPVYGEGATTGTPWWVSSSGGPNVSAAASYSHLMSLSAARYGGSGEGIYTGFFGVVDRGGAEPAGGMSGRLRWVWDFTPPTAQISGSGPFVSGSQASVNVTLSDNVGLDHFEIGPIFNLPHNLFDAGFAYVTPGQVNIGTGLGGPIIKNHSQTITDLVPKGLVFYDRIGGGIQAPVFNTIGAAVRSTDLARNRSNIGTIEFQNIPMFERPDEPTFIRFNNTQSTVCRGSPCSNGSGPNLDVTASWDSPLDIDPLNKFEVYTLTSNKRVTFLGRLGTPVRTSISGGFRFSASLTIDMSQYCGEGGTNLLIGLGHSKDRLFWYKNNSFPAVTVSEPTTMNPVCWTARRLLP